MAMALAQLQLATAAAAQWTAEQWCNCDGDGQWWREGNTVKEGNGSSTIAMGDNRGSTMDGGTAA